MPDAFDSPGPQVVQEPDDEDAAAGISVDWRAYSQTHTLTDKQKKLAEKVRKRENRISALQKEVDKIRVRSMPTSSASGCPCIGPLCSELTCFPNIYRTHKLQ